MNHADEYSERPLQRAHFLTRVAINEGRTLMILYGSTMSSRRRAVKGRSSPLENT